MSELKFVSAYRPPEGKQGKLPRDKDGNYEVLVGAYNEMTTSGEIYNFTDRVKALFTRSTMITKLNRNQLFGEREHPSLDDYISKTRTESQAVAMWINRLRRIDSKNLSHQTFGVRFAPLDKKVNGRTVFGVYLWVNPLDEKLKSLLDNPQANTAFSVRSFVDRKYSQGQIFCETKDIITHDWIMHGGIPIATKHSHPGLQNESYVPPSICSATINSSVIAELEAMDSMSSEAGIESGEIVSTMMIRGMMGWCEVPCLDHLASRLF